MTSFWKYLEEKLSTSHLIKLKSQLKNKILLEKIKSNSVTAVSSNHWSKKWTLKQYKRTDERTKSITQWATETTERWISIIQKEAHKIWRCTPFC